MLKTWMIILASIVVYGGSVWGMWIYRGEQKDKEFAERIRTTPATLDTTTTETVTPQAPQHHQGTMPAHMTPIERAEADTMHDRALRVSLDSSRARNAYMSARVDTTIGTDSTGSVRVQYDPPTRMFTIGFQPPPIREIKREIMKTVYVPVIEHDSFTTRATIFTAGAAAAALLISLIH